jgi:hypothetical protein
MSNASPVFSEKVPVIRWQIGARFCALIALVNLCGCRGPARGASTIVHPLPVAEQVSSPGNYLVLGEVKKPGAIACAEKARTLSELIDEAGGFSDFAYLKRVLVVHSGVTNNYNFRQIKAGTLEDPIVPCGATVRVKNNGW